MISRRWLVALSLVLLSHGARAQSAPDGSYSRVNTFAAFTEYSNDSSHIFLGQARNRKIGGVGFQYSRRLFHRRLFDFAYQGEARPGIIESDPTEQVTTTVSAPATFAGTYVGSPEAVIKCTVSTSVFTGVPPGSLNYTTTQQTNCGRRRVFAQGLSPIGFRVTLLPHHRLQPSLGGLLGYEFSTQNIPVADAGSFNFTFGLSLGLELYRSHSQSVRLEYAIQHISDKGSSADNPGIDSGFIKLTYAFGR